MSSNPLANIKSIEDFDLKGQSVFLRLDLNVPLKNGVISDDNRIRAALPTIKYALDKGAKLILASHLGRPKVKGDREALSLAPVAERLSEMLGVEIILVEEPNSDAPKALLSTLSSKKIIMLENLRFDPDETKNSGELAERIANYTQVYINDAFGASHRAHTSVVGVPKLVEKKGIGFLIKKEIEMLSQVREAQTRPYWAVLGGAKVSDKIEVINSLMDKVDGLIIGGAMAYTFLAAQGHTIGKSLIEKDKIKFANILLERAQKRSRELLLPVDHRVVPELAAKDKVQITPGIEVPEGMMAVDIGPKTEALYCEKLKTAKLIFWNGPMGIFETPEYASGTFAVAEGIANNSNTTIVGGGDSAAAAKVSGHWDKFTHVSTGGGASLEFLQGVELPGLNILKGKGK